MLLALVAGLTVFKKGVSPAYRVLWLQLFISCVVEYAGACMRLSGEVNTVIYDVFILADACLLLTVSGMLWPEKKITLAGKIGAGIMLLIWLAECYQKRFTDFYNISYTTETILLFIFFLHLLYRAGLQSKARIVSLPEFWLTFSVLVSYGMLLFYFSMLKYATQNMSQKDNALLSDLPLIASNVGYFWLLICFIILFLQSRKLKTNA